MKSKSLVNKYSDGKSRVIIIKNNDDIICMQNGYRSSKIRNKKI